MYSSHSEDQLKVIFEKVSQELTKRMPTIKYPYKIYFPKGHIRKINDLIPRWPYLSYERSRTMACVIQLCDINRWNLNVWNIGLTAGSIWEWHATVPVIAVIETLLVEYCNQNKWVKGDIKFKRAIDTCNSMGVYPQITRDELHVLRDYRNEVHIFLKDKVELHDGLPKRYNNAVNMLKRIEDYVMTHWGKTKNA